MSRDTFCSYALALTAVAFFFMRTFDPVQFDNLTDYIVLVLASTDFVEVHPAALFFS